MACDTMNCSHNCMADRDSDEADRENSDHENYSEASQMISKILEKSLNS